MAYFLFAERILKGEAIDVFNHGDCKRDFTYIDDITDAVLKVLDRIPKPNPLWSSDNPDTATSNAPYRLYNIGNNNPVDLMRFIEVLENCLGKTAIKNMLPLQPGDVPATFADVSNLEHDIGFKPSTPIEEGLARFAEWYREFYQLHD